MPYCAVMGCRNDSRTQNLSNGISYHRFPKVPDLKNQWIDAVGKKNWFPAKSSTICSEHFKGEDFMIKRKGNKYIVHNAIPTQKIWSFQESRASKKRASNEALRCKSEAKLSSNNSGGKHLSKIVRNYRKKGSCSKESMQKAVHAVLSKSAGYSKASKLYGIPQTTLERHVANLKNEPAEQIEFTSTSNTSFEDENSTPDMLIDNIELPADVSSEDEANIPDVETINTQALEVTLARIRANPQLYIGIPKNFYHLIDIIHKQTEIPTTHILLCLKKIKLDTHIEELADQFGITADEASDIFISNVPALANILHTFVDNHELQIPLRSEHSSCVIDSLEINVQPSSDNSRELTQTERGNTVKYVVCCTPDGYINYVSPGYGGRQSDDRLLEDTNYLDRLKSGDSVMPNGLRNVESLILQKDLKVVKPRARQKHTAGLQATQYSTNNESQMSEDQLERLVQRIREFTMVRDRSVLSCDLVRVLDEAVVISCALINLQSFVIN